MINIMKKGNQVLWQIKGEWGGGLYQDWEGTFKLRVNPVENPRRTLQAEKVAQAKAQGRKKLLGFRGQKRFRHSYQKNAKGTVVRIRQEEVSGGQIVEGLISKL